MLSRAALPYSQRILLSPTLPPTWYSLYWRSLLGSVFVSPQTRLTVPSAFIIISLDRAFVPVFCGYHNYNPSNSLQSFIQPWRLPVFSDLKAAVAVSLRLWRTINIPMPTTRVVISHLMNPKCEPHSVRRGAQNITIKGRPVSVLRIP